MNNANLYARILRLRRPLLVLNVMVSEVLKTITVLIGSDPDSSFRSIPRW